jgi:predicted metalloprotease with PDZ domain
MPGTATSLLLALSAFTSQPGVPPAGSDALVPIRYTLRFPAPATHRVEVEAVFPTGGRADLDLMMAVWTPGSYLVREFARNVADLAAAVPDGTPLPVVATRKNRWRVTTRGAPSIRLRYSVYSREMSVRTNWVEAQFALLNGAPTFITLAGETSRPHDVRLELPPAWKQSVTALPAAPGGAPHHYLAADYDTLVDSPILAGNPAVYDFTVSGKPIRLANEGEAGVWDGARSAQDVATLVGAAGRLWGFLPFDAYVFLNVITEAGGGLEHKNSTVLMTSRWATRTRADYLDWLGLVGHELFHAWNGKRLRPIALGPFDYENEVYSPDLWIVEGFTDYYGALLLRRAGFFSDAEYLTELSQRIRDLQATPGRLVQPAAQASSDAWIRFYRPDENSPNASVSYYTKGGVIAFLLDATIRRATGGARSLDDLMRLAYSRHSGERGFTSREFRQAASDAAGTDLHAWLAETADGTGDLDYAPALAWFGLRFRTQNGGEPKAWLGAGTRAADGRLVVTQVRRGTPAFEAGLNVDDEIVAIDDFRVRADQLQSRLEKYQPGQRVSVLVARRDQLLRVPVTLGADPGDPWRIEIDPASTPEQAARRKAWLDGVD